MFKKQPREPYRFPELAIKTREEYPPLTQEQTDALEKWLGEMASMLYFKGAKDNEKLKEMLAVFETIWLKDNIGDPDKSV